MYRKKEKLFFVWSLRLETGKNFIIYSEEEPEEYLKRKIMTNAPFIHSELIKCKIGGYATKILATKCNQEEAVKNVVYYNKKLNPRHREIT